MMNFGIFLPILYFVLLVAILYVLARPILRGALYFPATARSVNDMVRIADMRPGQKIADIGSGDGRILIAFAKKGVQAHGYEINPLLVLQSRWAIRQAHLERFAFVHWKDFWKVNFAGFDAAVVYGMPHIMDDLGKKLEREADPEIKVISNVYHFHGKKALLSEGDVHLYHMGREKERMRPDASVGV